MRCLSRRNRPHPAALIFLALCAIFVYYSTSEESLEDAQAEEVAYSQAVHQAAAYDAAAAASEAAANAAKAAAHAEESARKVREAEAALVKAQQAKKDEERSKAWLKTEIHPAYQSLLKEYPFQKMIDQSGNTLNIMLVRNEMNARQKGLFEKYKDEILFIGISSFEDFPLPSVNPFSPKYAVDAFTGLLPAWLHMMRPPDALKYFPPHVKVLLMSQSDFSLPYPPKRDYNTKMKYDFTYSGSDQDVRYDCVGWSSFAKNWSFVKESLEVMCGEFGMTGVLVATKDKQGVKACEIPKSCEGKILQTKFLNQDQFFGYMRESRFQFMPQIHDASPRVAAQALMHDKPLLMNAYISGGWKYVDDECTTTPCKITGRVESQRTGEFFTGMDDFRDAVRKIVAKADVPHYYEPQKYMSGHFGDQIGGKKLLAFVRENFGHRVKLPDDISLILPGGFS